CLARNVMFGASGRLTSMLCLSRHPLALLTGGSNESTAICSWVGALRQAAQDLELPLVRRRNSSLKGNWNQTGISDQGCRMEGSRAVGNSENSKGGRISNHGTGRDYALSVRTNADAPFNGPGVLLIPE